MHGYMNKGRRKKAVKWIFTIHCMYVCMYVCSSNMEERSGENIKNALAYINNSCMIRKIQFVSSMYTIVREKRGMNARIYAENNAWLKRNDLKNNFGLYFHAAVDSETTYFLHWFAHNLFNVTVNFLWLLSVPFVWSRAFYLFPFFSRWNVRNEN